MKNFIIIQIARYAILSVKNWLYRTFTDESRKNIIALMVMPDIMFPEKITVGEIRLLAITQRF